MTRRAAAAAFAALLLLTACPEREPPCVGCTSPVRGGTLVMAVRDLTSLDPAKASGTGARAALAQLFDPLTRVDPATNRVTGAAASSWRVSPDGLRWVFVLSSRGRFSDGSAVTAADFKFAFDRLARRDTRSDAAFALEQVRGFREAHDLGSAQTLSGVTAPSPRRLVITLERPFAELPYVLSHPQLVPLPAARYTRTTRGLDAARYVNGAFRVKTFRANERVVLERNPATGGGAPYLDGIEFRVVRSVDDGWRLYQDGEAHIADVPAEVLQAGGSFGTGGFTPAWATLSFGLNLAHAKYRSPQVRQALSLAIDRAAIAQTVYGGTKTPATGLVPEGIRGFRADMCRTCALDRDRARNILRAAFAGRPPAITIDHLNERSSRAVARAVASGLQEVGIRATPRAHSLRAYRAFLAAGRHDMAELGWVADTPTPDGFLAQQLRTGSANNETGFKDALFDRRIDQARRERSEERRVNAYVAAERRALDLMPMIPVVFFRNRMAVAKRVHGFVLNGAGIFDGRAVWFSSR